MAKAKSVPGDQRSQEFDELRKTVHSILFLLENFKTGGVAMTDAATTITALRELGDAVANGTTASTHGVAPSRKVQGVVPKVKTKNLPADTTVVNLVATDKHY